MSDSNNMFEEFVKRFYIRFGKLQVEGFHHNSINNHRTFRSVSPTKKYSSLFNVNANVKRTRLQ